MNSFPSKNPFQGSAALFIRVKSQGAGNHFLSEVQELDSHSES